MLVQSLKLTAKSAVKEREAGEELNELPFTTMRFSITRGNQYTHFAGGKRMTPEEDILIHNDQILSK